MTSGTAKDRSRERWMAAALVAAALLPFLATLTFDFVYDDRWIVRGNEAIRGWGSLLTLWTKPYWVMETSRDAGLYRPLLMVIFATLWNAGLRFPIWFHLLAVAAHVTVTLLLWRVIRRAVAPGIAAIATLWFAVQPLHIEPVANIASSSEVLVTVLVLTLVLFVKRRDERTGVGDEISWRTAGAAGVLYAAALLTKESGVTAPAIALLVVWGWRAPAASDRPFAGAVATLHRWRRLVLVCAGAFVVVLAARVAVLGSVVSEGSIAAPAFANVSTLQRIWAMFALGPKILALLTWPRTLNPSYGARAIEGHLGPSVPAIASMAVFAVVGVLVWRLATRGDRRPATGLAWMVIAFLPASNLLMATGQVLAERTLYLSSAGATLLIAAVADMAWARLTLRSSRWARPVMIACAVIAPIAIVVAGRNTSLRSHVWKNHESLFRQMIAADTGDYNAYRALATYEAGRGDMGQALALVQRAYAINPKDRELIADYARLLLETGQPAHAAQVAAGLMTGPDARRDREAVTLYLQSLAQGFGPDSVLVAARRLRVFAPTPRAAFFIGSAQLAHGDSAGARAVFRAGLTASPPDSAATRLLRLSLDFLDSPRRPRNAKNK